MIINGWKVRVVFEDGDLGGFGAWLTDANGNAPLRDDFERKHVADTEPDFSGFDTQADLELAIKKWALRPASAVLA